MRRTIILLLFVFVSLLGCSSIRDVAISRIDDTVLKSVAICPFQVETMENVQVQGMMPPVHPALFKLETGGEGADVTLTNIFENNLFAGKRVTIVPAVKTANVFRKTVSDSLDADMASVIKKLGKQLNVDAVCVGYLYRWQEREGTRYAAKRPASVAFSIHVYRTSDGKIVWKGLFDQTQKSLTENLLRVDLFVKRGYSWITANELADDGINEMLESFLYDK